MRGSLLAPFPSLLAAFCLALVLAPALAPAQGDEPLPGSGALQIVDREGRPAGDCPLERTDVSVEISGFVARVRVVQRFRNPRPVPVEAIYTFPLSHRGAVDAMWMRSEGRTVRAEIRRREEAEQLYEAARAAGKLASRLDQERPNVFTQSVANLMPNTRVEIEIHYVETLEYEAGSFAFAFPTVVGPRFVPGNATGRSGTGWAPDTDRVPDASRITPPVAAQGTRSGHDLGIEVDVDAGLPILALEAPLHEVELAHESGARRARVRLARRYEIPNRDFVLRWQVAGEELRSGWLAHRTGEGDGYLTLLFVPPARLAPRDAAPKELVFVVDRSGSQQGLPLAKAKETLLWILDHMNPDDTFQVIDFGSTSSRLFERPEPASPAMKARARRYIEALEANGGTMMAEAVREAASVPADRNRLRVVTFMTDGFVGNDLEVIGLVRELRGTSRWFSFGTGNSVNRFLLDEMARAGGGEVEYVLLQDSGEAVARRFWQRIGSPVLTDVRLAFEGLDVADVMPADVSDVWAERPLLVHARYGRAGRGRVVVTGFRGGEPYREVLEVALPSLERDHDALASIWARARVEELLRRDLAALQSGSYPATLRSEVEEVALAHALVTPFTSFVAVEDRVVNRGGRLETVTVPVEMPQGVTHEGVFGEAQADASGRVGALASTPLATNGGGRTQQPSAPEAHSWKVRRYIDVGRLTRGRGADDERLATPPPAEKREARPHALAQRARERLAPELLALVERGTSSPRIEERDGRVRVRVVLDAASQEVVRRLEAAGLDVRQRADGWLVGWIAPDDLADLAALPGVLRIELP
jgi:Ca-activated chloride channel family protein